MCTNRWIMPSVYFDRLNGAGSLCKWASQRMFNSTTPTCLSALMSNETSIVVARLTVEQYFEWVFLKTELTQNVAYHSKQAFYLIRWPKYLAQIAQLLELQYWCLRLKMVKLKKVWSLEKRTVESWSGSGDESEPVRALKAVYLACVAIRSQEINFWLVLDCIHIFLSYYI